MPHFIRVNMTTGNVRSLPLSPERNQLGGRALVSQVLYTEMAPNTDPLGADNSLVLAAGLLVGQPLSCFDELVLGSKS
ncbi:MAG: aldehyde ferredoxin oxidoreductase, partial [Mailhella sp.]|nr:aldehyde ferredoxin oxidoreductase [Mailhella sp.]